MWNLAPRLPGEIVILEPLSEEHFGALLEAARPPEIWSWWTVAMAGEAAFRPLVRRLRCARGAEGTRAPFATLDARTERPIGSHQLSDAATRARRTGDRLDLAEPGRVAQRRERRGQAAVCSATPLRQLGCQRVEFSTNERNERARRALEALPGPVRGRQARRPPARTTEAGAARRSTRSSIANGPPSRPTSARGVARHASARPAG